MKATSFYTKSFLVVTFLTLFWGSASAHIGEPLSTRVWNVGGQWVLETNFGMVGPHFEGFVCEEAFLGGDRFFIAPLAADRWLTFSATEVRQTEDGCTFTPVQALTGLPADVDVHETSGKVAWVSNNSGPQLMVYANGEVQEGPTIDSEQQLTSVRFASDTVLVMGAYHKTMAGAGTLFRYDIAERSLTTIEVGQAITYPYILDAEGEALLWLGRVDAQALHWGTFEAPMQTSLEIASWPTDARIVDDSKVVVAGLSQSRGLTIGSRVGEDVTWESFNEETSAACVRPYEDGYLVCTLRRFDDADLVFIKPGEEPVAMVNFLDLEGARQCPASSDVEAVCPTVWPEIARQLGLVPTQMEPDIMEPSPDADMGDVSITPPSGDEGCSAAGIFPMLWFSVLLPILIRRRRNQRS